MFKHICDSRLAGIFAVLLLFVTGVSTVLAEQVTLSYVDANAEAQTLNLDCDTSTENLALAAGLLGEGGVGLVYDPDSGCGTLAELAAALATAAPVHAAKIARALAEMSPDDAAAIAAAINMVPGVNTVAVLAAVQFWTFRASEGPQSIGSGRATNLALTRIERAASRN